MSTYQLPRSRSNACIIIVEKKKKDKKRRVIADPDVEMISGRGRGILVRLSKRYGRNQNDADERRETTLTCTRTRRLTRTKPTVSPHFPPRHSPYIAGAFKEIESEVPRLFLFFPFFALFLLRRTRGGQRRELADRWIRGQWSETSLTLLGGRIKRLARARLRPPAHVANTSTPPCGIRSFFY